MQETCRAFSLAFAKTGKSIAARIAMMAITTSNSTKVKPFAFRKTSLGCLVFIINFNFNKNRFGSMLDRLIGFFPGRESAIQRDGVLKIIGLEIFQRTNCAIVAHRAVYE